MYITTVSLEVAFLDLLATLAARHSDRIVNIPLMMRKSFSLHLLATLVTFNSDRIVNISYMIRETISPHLLVTYLTFNFKIFVHCIYVSLKISCCKSLLATNATADFGSVNLLNVSTQSTFVELFTTLAARDSNRIVNIPFMMRKCFSLHLFAALVTFNSAWVLMNISHVVPESVPPHHLATVLTFNLV